MKLVRVAAVLALIASALTMPVRAADIDACKYVSVTEPARDRNGVAAEVRKEVAARGFVVVTDAATIPLAEMFKACVITADWLGEREAATGELVLQVMDAVTGTPIAVSRVSNINWFGINKTVRTSLAQIFQDLRYTGFKEDVYRSRMERLYPPRPKLAVSEEEVAPHTDGIEGIWTQGDQQYRLGIVALAEPGGPDYAAVIIQATAPLWQPGEIKAEFTRGSEPDRFKGTYYLLNKQPVTIDFTLSGGDRLTGVVMSGATAIEITLLRAQ
jgi:hypothetical protein